MRLYTGISLDPRAEENLVRIQDRLRPLAAWKWSPAENLHITTKFIGEWPEARLPDLHAALGGLAKPGGIPIRLDGFGWFPDARNPKGFYAAVVPSAPLTDLAAATNRALAALGVPPEAKAYVPHVTLARIKDSATGELIDVRKQLAEITDLDLGSFEATRFHLYLSTPGPAASVYRKLASFPLREVAA